MRVIVNYLTGYILKKGFIRKLLSSYIITLLLLMSFSVLFTSPGLANEDKIGSDLPDLGGIISSPSESVGGESLPKAPPSNIPPVVYDMPDQEIEEGETFTQIILDGYVNDPDNPDEELTWTYTGNTELIVDITDRIATITTPNIDWYGEESITFQATDPFELSDEDSVTFTVNQATPGPPSFPPAIPGQVPGGAQSGGEAQSEEFGGEEGQCVSEGDDSASGGSTNPVTEPQGEDSSSSNSISTFYIRPENAQHETGIVCIEIRPTKYFTNIGAVVSNNHVKPQNIPDVPLDNKDNSINGYTSMFLIGDNKILTDGDIEYMKIEFKVNKTWMRENKINKDSVEIKQFRQQFIGGVLPGYYNDGWQSLTSTLSSEDEEYFYYKVDAPGCSATFAIIGTEIVEVHPYQSPGQAISWTVIIGIVISASVLLVIILFKAGYIYTDEEKLIKKPVEKTHKPKINKITQIIAVLLFWI